MSEKTNLTNEEVQESSKSEASRQTAGKPDLNESENWKNRAKEYESKYNTVAEKISHIEEEKADLESRLSELEEKDRLTKAEQAEKSRLEDKVEGLEEGLFQLEHDPKYAVMREKFKRTKAEAIVEATNTVKKELAYENSVSLAGLYVELQAEKDGISPKEMEDKIESVLKADESYFKRLMPYERARKAIAIIRRESETNKKLKEYEEKSKKGDSFSENSNTIPPSEKSTSQLIKEGNIDAALSRI